MGYAFNPIHSKYDGIYINDLIHVDAPGQFSSVKKSYPCFLPRILGKIIHWILNPNERISKVRDAFNAFVADSDTLKKCKTLEEQATLYANLSNFNRQVIEKHNTTYLFWSRVPLIDLSPLEEKIKATLTQSLSNIDVCEATQLRAGINILESIEAADTLSVELRVLHTRLDTSCRIYARQLANSIDNDANYLLYSVDSLGIRDLRRYNQIQRIINYFVMFEPMTKQWAGLKFREGDNFLAKSEHFLTALWAPVAANVETMRTNEKFQAKVLQAARKEIVFLQGQIDEIKAQIDKPKDLDLTPICDKINALRQEDLKWLTQFLPDGDADHEKVKAAIKDYQFLKDVAKQYPAYKQELVQFRDQAGKEIQEREAAFENYGDIENQIFSFEPDFIKLILKRYDIHHSIYQDYFRNRVELDFVQSISWVSKKLLEFKVAPSLKDMSAETAQKRLEEVEKYIDVGSHGYSHQAPKLTAKWQALKAEVATAWEPLRQQLRAPK